MIFFPKKVVQRFWSTKYFSVLQGAKSPPMSTTSYCTKFDYNVVIKHFNRLAPSKFFLHARKEMDL